jgi:hypothetical protein
VVGLYILPIRVFGALFTPDDNRTNRAVGGIHTGRGAAVVMLAWKLARFLAVSNFHNLCA